MPEAKKVYGSVKRFGPRYGASLKQRYGKAEEEKRLSKKCPYCSYNKARRIAAGIWHCKKCKSKFTARAYSIQEKKVEAEAAITAATEKEVEEEPEEMEAAETIAKT